MRNSSADRRFLHFAAGIHHQHAFGDLRHHPQIVGDENDGGAHPLLELAHQIEDLRLNGHIERGGRLVGDQELRVAGERHGDHHPLPHAAGELMRIFAHAPLRLGDADQSQHLHRTSLRRLSAKTLMQPQRFADLAADREDRIEARHRLLEDHADLDCRGCRASRAHRA